MKTWDKIFTIWIILSVVWIVLLGSKVIADRGKEVEVEFIITGKYNYGLNKTAIQTAAGKIRVFYTIFTEEMHPGEIWRVIYKGREIIEAEKLGEIAIITGGN